MEGAGIRRPRTTLLHMFSSPEQQRAAGDRPPTLLDAIQEEAASDRRSRPVRVSLMALLAIGERENATHLAGFFAGDAAAPPPEEEEEEEERVLCCVCMVRRKGAAFIPCGHTFCRVCSRELVIGRGSCPICNEIVFDILNIF